MATLRPVGRLLPRLNATLRTTITYNTPLKPHLHHRTLHPCQTSAIHTTQRFRREDGDNLNSTRVRNPAPTNTDSTTTQQKPQPTSATSPPQTYTFQQIQTLVSSPDGHPNILLIDVREPAELDHYGRIPTALNVPIKTSPDSFFMPAEDFEDKYGFARPGSEHKVIFYCKAGVRSRAAATLARQAGFGGTVAEFPGSFDEWLARGGEVQR